MLAIDTNVVVRYLTGDHPKQSPRARAVIDENDTYLSTTVFLESEWVLRSVYEYPPAKVYDALRAIAGLPRVTVESPALIAEALDRAERGMDFADALHLGSAADCEAMLTFDRRFIKSATAVGSATVREP
jgi:predicted nucleic-acid-binding protein